MRFYQYISDSKTDMLFPQIPPPLLEGLSAELGFDFKLLKGKISTSKLEMTSRIAKVEAVERHLVERGGISDDIHERAWIKGRARFRCGYLPSCKGLILFAGHFNGHLL